MPPLLPQQAVWVTFSPRSQSRHVLPESPAGIVLREGGVRLAGFDHVNGAFRAGTPCSPTHLVWIALRGRASFASGPKRGRLSAGKFALGPAGHPHWVSVPSGAGPTVAAWFHLERSPAWAFLERRPPCLAPTHDPAPGLLLEMLLAERQDNPISVQLARHHAAALLLALRRELGRIDLIPSSAELAWGPRMAALGEAVAADPARPWTVAAMASQVGASAAHLHRLCLRHWGAGPLRQVRRLRMEKAAALLLHTGLRLEEIAGRTGYESPYAFSDAFARHAGLRPGAFRRRARESPLPKSVTSHPSIRSRTGAYSAPAASHCSGVQ